MRKRKKARGKGMRPLLLLICTLIAFYLTVGVFEGAISIDTLWGFAAGYTAIIFWCAFLWSLVPEEGTTRRRVILLCGLVPIGLVCIHMAIEGTLPLLDWATGDQDLEVLNLRQLRVILSSWYRIAYFGVWLIYILTSGILAFLFVGEEPPEVIYMWAERSQY